MTLYEYGALAWVWRTFIAGGTLLAIAFFASFVASWNPWLLLGSVALAAPALFFGSAVAVRVDLTDSNTLLVRTLLFSRRRIPRSELGVPSIRRTYEDVSITFNAPRVWVPVKGRLPLYFDLLARIPDTQAFYQAIGLRASGVRDAK